MKLKKRARNEDQKFERRSWILDKAFEIFLKTSYDLVSMDQVAEKTGLAKGTLYLYFQSKEELFLALKIREYERWFDELDRNLESAPSRASSRDRIRWFSKLVGRSFQHRRPMVRLIVSLHHLLERNIRKEVVLTFNRQIGGRLLKTGSLLEGSFPSLKKGEGVRLLLWIKAAVIGLYYTAEPVPVVKKAIKPSEPALALFELDWLKELSDLLVVLLEGWVGLL